MKLEILIFIYSYVCLCVVLFDFVFVNFIKLQTQGINKIKSQLLKLILNQIDFLVEKGEFDDKLQLKMVKKLRRVKYLGIFNDCICELRKTTPDFDIYLSRMAPYLIYLSRTYEKRPNEQKALFAYVLSNLNLGQNSFLTDTPDNVNLVMLCSRMENYLLNKSVYVKENAFKAIVSFGIEQGIEDVFNLMSEHRIRHSEKLIADDLLEFPGNKQKLSDMLFKRLTFYETGIQCGVINYLRLLDLGEISQEHYYDKLYELLVSDGTNKEIRFAIIRYFKKFRFEPVAQVLIKLLENSAGSKWEYAAISASALGSYCCDEAVSALKLAVQSPNWYVRLNAAESLLSFGFEIEELAQDMQDLYASDMLMYRDKVRRLKEKKLSYVELPEGLEEEGKELAYI